MLCFPIRKDEGFLRSRVNLGTREDLAMVLFTIELHQTKQQMMPNRSVICDLVDENFYDPEWPVG